jgi:hypothetical protein
VAEAVLVLVRERVREPVAVRERVRLVVGRRDLVADCDGGGVTLREAVGALRLRDTVAERVRVPDDERVADGGGVPDADAVMSHGVMLGEGVPDGDSSDATRRPTYTGAPAPKLLPPLPPPGAASQLAGIADVSTALV